MIGAKFGIALRRFVVHFDNRLPELGAALMMLGLAIEIALWPGVIEASAFSRILDVLPRPWLGWGFLIAGTLRLAALLANGALPYYGGILRAGGAFSGAMIWFQMCLALFVLVPELGRPPSPGIPIYLVLTMVELVSIYLALRSVRRHEVP